MALRNSAGYHNYRSLEVTFCVVESKQQILANLANFAYDPINYEFIRQLNIVDLFLGMNFNFEVHNTNLLRWKER